ncbi:peptidoglycan-binding protein [Bradyrhizobium septentrionale]|uniref:Peptidoglycan-binding protein n=1 Tax=Bradyrhizobium septentrionale TaxID=1404411 RepID=A0A974A3K4_9BRAD|nr:peptidoglycan-binding protein [Bradyrhizobium septentrionale]UGY15097.1 peptidoglycan-binding protein [Bradyrhizobium septentrionale]
MFDLHGISQAAFDLIVESEVSSREVYEHRYRHPEWPGEQSGVTIGIGYDVGQTSRAQFIADWSGKIPDAMVKALAKTCGVTGVPARALAQKLRAVVDIPWDVAEDVFSNHDVPRYMAMLRHGCPGVDELAPDCKGVLLSVVFNRGASFSNAGPRFAEMRDIRSCVKSGNLERIPGLIRSMKRLWPDSRGLRDRRDAEAALFERGLETAHPQAFAALASVPDHVDPDTVAHVQQKLRELGYPQVGAVDGNLTPHGKTEDAILAFRNKNGLPLTPTIDDDFLTALAKATPPEVSEERANASASDLREQGSDTISFTDKVKGWGGRLFGGGTGLGVTGALGLVTEKATAISSAKEAVGGLGISETGWVVIGAAVVVLVVLAAAGLAVWFVADKIERRHVDDYRAGRA